MIECVLGGVALRCVPGRWTFSGGGRLSFRALLPLTWRVAVSLQRLGVCVRACVCVCSFTSFTRFASKAQLASYVVARTLFDLRQRFLSSNHLEHRSLCQK